MTGSEDELLTSELGALGGGGSAWAARRLGVDVHELEMTCSAPMDEVLVEVDTLIATMGKVVARSGPTDGRAIVRVVTGSGALNLNPTVVTVTVSSIDSAGTKVHIRGVAKEGLIKQRAGRKAAERFAALLT
ncbi:hypothetical protein ACWEKM_33825 [Streptomyces sp. NPDC004752]